MGIEPTLAAWEAAVLPLNYTRLGYGILRYSDWRGPPWLSSEVGDARAPLRAGRKQLMIEAL